MWQDLSFPQAKACGPWGRENGFDWKPARETARESPPAVLFENGVEPNDICQALHCMHQSVSLLCVCVCVLQGFIGNCWLVSTIAAVAEYPAAIYALFPNNPPGDLLPCVT
jgi:hypothetical protein